MRVCHRTGKLVRVYLEAALVWSRGSDKIATNKQLLQTVSDAYRGATEDREATDYDVAEALIDLRKHTALPSLKKIRKAVAAEILQQIGRESMDSPGPGGTVDGH